MNKWEAVQLARQLRKNQTAAEGLIWNEVRNRRLLGLKFTRQYPIEYAHGRYFIADFHCDAARLIIEIDGEIHWDQKDYDEGRSAILKELRYTILRFSNLAVFNQTNEVVQKIKKYLRSK